LKYSPRQIVLPRPFRRGVLSTMSPTPFGSEESRRAHERRRVPRLRLPSLAYVDVDSDNGGILLNLSEAGLALQAVAPFSGLTRVTLRIQPPKPRKRLDLNAEITWLSESKKEAGLRFLELEEDTRIEIANWISAERAPREPRAASDSAAPLTAEVSHARFPEEAPVPRSRWSRALETSPSYDAPPNRKIPGELPSPLIASGGLEPRPSAILRERSVDVPAPNPAPGNEKIHAPTTSPIEGPVEPVIFSAEVLPAAPSPSQESPRSEEEPPRRRKWSCLVENSSSQNTPPIQKTPGEIPRRAVGSTYIERLTDAILRKNFVDVSPKSPISPADQIHARASSSNVQPDGSITLSQIVSDAAQSPSVEQPPPPALPATIPPLPAAGPNIQPPPAPSAEPIATPDETPKIFLPSTSETFPRSGERRRSTRQRIFSLAYLEVGSDNGGMVLDLSARGLALQAFNPLIGLTRVSLRIQPPKSRKRIAATAAITWLSPSKTEAGVQFLDLTEDASMEIADWISAEAAVPEPPSHDDSASRNSADASATKVSSAPDYDGQNRVREEWSPLFAELNPGESSANQNAFNDLPKTATGRENFASQPGSALSEESSEHTAKNLETCHPATRRRAGNGSDAPVSSPAFSEPVPNVARPFLSEQFRKWGTIAVLCTCVALVFLFVGMAISRKLLSDRVDRLSAEGHTRDSAASSPSPATPATSVTYDASSGHAAMPVEASRSRTQPPNSEIVSRAPKDEIRGKHGRENPKSRITGGETDPIAAALPPAIVPSPETANRDAQSVAVPSLPVWSVQAAGSRAPASVAPVAAPSPTTNSVSARVAERRVDSYLLYRVEPLYPREAKVQRIEGTVTVHLQIGTNGRVSSSRELSGPDVLVPAALAAVREWRFIPALLNGQPVESEKDVSIEFQLWR
jgi:TonB family protein